MCCGDLSVFIHAVQDVQNGLIGKQQPADTCAVLAQQQQEDWITLLSLEMQRALQVEHLYWRAHCQLAAAQCLYQQPPGTTKLEVSHP